MDATHGPVPGKELVKTQITEGVKEINVTAKAGKVADLYVNATADSTKVKLDTTPTTYDKQTVEVNQPWSKTIQIQPRSEQYKFNIPGTSVTYPNISISAANSTRQFELTGDSVTTKTRLETSEEKTQFNLKAEKKQFNFNIESDPALSPKLRVDVLPLSKTVASELKGETTTEKLQIAPAEKQLSVGVEGGKRLEVKITPDNEQGGAQTPSRVKFQVL
eukprot:GSA120T00012150001.1